MISSPCFTFPLLPSLPMPPKADPYATKGARAVDLILIALAIAAIALVILTSPRHQQPVGTATVEEQTSAPIVR
jgi:hypothetical protein